MAGARKRIPWVRLNSDYINDPKLKIGRCRAVWPWVLTVLKRWRNSAPHEELHYQVAALDLDMPEEITGPQMIGCLKVGLLVDDGEGHYYTPNWDNYQLEKRTNRRSTGKRSTDHPLGSALNPGSYAPEGDDPRNDAELDRLGDDPGIMHQNDSDPAVSLDHTMLTVNRCLGDLHSDHDPSLKMGSAGAPAPWAWREIFLYQGRQRWTVGSVEDAFKRLWPRERMSKQIQGFAREASTYDPELLDRAFALISPDCSEAGDEWPRCYSLKKAIGVVKRQPKMASTPEQLFEESTSASLGRLTLGDDRSRRERQMLAAEFERAETCPSGDVLTAVRLSFAERGLAIPALFAEH